MFPTHPAARKVLVGLKVNSADCLASIRVQSPLDLLHRAMEMQQPAIDNDRVQLKVNRRMTRDPADEIDRAASEYRTMKVKCLAALVVPADLTANIADTGHVIASLVQSETTIKMTNMQNLRHSLIRENNGWKCNESKRKLQTWEQCNRLQWLKA
jgi:hypothetical protein